ncbi:hypothetical protein O7627_07110 [Solwaraspora sp. WMMD1047]|uniref:hypothetical protein n=1 Tax=Solwaraspora sp. WMMD1047 TaxID=3016102 RepID=UPI00241747C5|nr:hypothetical protein [Solwaraspora sp. WMMD1047]MDG4829075.1 hypothetical protein [Solwaraspora sp. WMMD1047]
MALLLDLANIVGGFLLAIALLRRLPRVGDDLGRFADRMAPFGWVVGIVALVTGGYYLLVHLISGPRVFHYEVVGLGVGVALLWDRLTGRRANRAEAPAGGGPVAADAATGVGLLLAIFGLIAIVVGIQGLFTPDG